jgi:alanyl-tRNA synthetase
MSPDVPTSAQIRRSFLEFFAGKGHTIVPSSSLMPDSPNLLFTNAGMNQFVPIFLNEIPCPYDPPRAADTQKCIRAGGKHNDLDDVGLDTYHHTFFEMLGNWSFGDYFKREAIGWSWELLVDRLHFPPERLYATIYQPGPGDPSERDQEAWEIWAEKFRAAGLDPGVHIVPGDKKDNFWMMGETGPGGPCSEIHIDLTPAGDTKGALVNQGTAECIEIWNNVFIQFNANPDGTFSPLPARHVDTGMGFERLVSIIQGTNNFTDFANARISNYETDIFRPIFDELEKMSGHRYGRTLPQPNATGQPVPVSEQEQIDVAFRVIGDHIRTLSFAIADGIQPGNTDRNYVLRRILRRAVRYGRTLGFRAPFFHQLTGVLAREMGDVFPEIRAKRKQVEEVLLREEEAFNKTLDTGIEIFNEGAAKAERIAGDFAFKLYDTYGFPLDLTELMARERGLTVDTAGFESEMEKQRARARAAQKRQVIELSEVETKEPTKFVGYDSLSTPAKVLEVLSLKDKTAVVLDASAAYAEMGGQVGDEGELAQGASVWRVANTQKTGHTWLHFLETGDAPAVGSEVTLTVDRARRRAIERHHSVTHLLHWALHEVVSKEATQKGSFVGPDKLTFDFNSPALTAAQVRDVERLVNERIVENAPIAWREVPYAQVKGDASVMQFFGDKYGEVVRVVDIGGYSKELCAGTHVRATGEVGLFRIAGEAAIAAGVRRIEAQAGLNACELAVADAQRLAALAAKLGTPLAEMEKRIDGLLAQQKELEKSLKAAQQREAAGRARDLLAGAATIGGTPAIIAKIEGADGDTLQTVADALKASGFKGVTVLGGTAQGAVALVASVSPEFTAKAQAGKIIQGIAPKVGGKGGGKPDAARGGGKDPSGLDAALEEARRLLGQA